MAKKSKTQRAKASANRAAKKEQRVKDAEVTPVVEEAPKKRFGFKKSSPAKVNTQKPSQPAAKAKKPAEKPKKKRFGFLSDVRSEMRRVTWPTKQDVLQWTGVVIVALLFFGVFVAIFDNWVVTPILFAISSLGA
ncbi:MAG: preprotein translocase subunit SecE [Eggerthellaceae bacterium]